jgi:hypothetical protein
MQIQNEIPSRKTIARRAGLLYLIWIMTGLYSMFFIPSRIQMEGDAGVISNSILSNELLFRSGMVNGLISMTLWVFMVLIFYRLFRVVDKRQARLLFALVIVQIPIGFIVEGFNMTSLMILKGEALTTLDPGERQNFAVLFLRVTDYIVAMLTLFWGLWLFPLGILVYKSCFIPRFVGVWLIINGVALVVLFFTGLLLPQYNDLVFMIAFPAMLGEVVFMLWLLIKGAKPAVMNRQTVASPVS